MTATLQKFTAVQLKWLLDNRVPAHATAEAPGWPPGRFFRKVLRSKMRGSGQVETAYLMLEPGKHLCLKVQELRDIPTRFSQTVYHGTSLGALEKIMTEGFRPSVGAGSEAAGKKFGCALPMVYTSGLLETARGYVGNVENGQRIGSDERCGPIVNCVIWMQADPDKRLFHKKARKNKSGQLRNEQQGYHPDDLRITKIYLHCIKAGNTSPQKAKYGDGELNGEQRRRLNGDLRAAAELLFNEDQAPWWTPPPKVIQQKKKDGVAALALAPAPPESMEKDEGVQLSDSTGEPAEPSFCVSLQRADPVLTGSAAREQLGAPRIPPPAAKGSQRSRSPRQRRGDTRRLCINVCGRPAATGFVACYRTCSTSGGISAGVTREHGPRCNAAWQRANEQPSPAPEQTTWDAAKSHAMLLLPSAAASRDTGTVNELPTPVLEPTSRDAQAAPSATASGDAPMRDHQYCVNCCQRRGDERCIRCNLHPLCTRCMPMHGCIP